MMPRRKRVQVGWYCNHEHEPLGQRTHMSSHGKWKRGKWIETVPQPETYQALQFLDHREPKKLPACPLAEPVYVYRDAS